MDIVTDISLWELVKHATRWLINLRRAGDARKTASVKALRKVILAARHTNAYVRQIDDTGIQDHPREAHLATMWTELGFELADLGLSKLSKRCDISGRYWADPEQFDEAFLEKADVGLARVEELAMSLVAEIER